MRAPSERAAASRDDSAKANPFSIPLASVDYVIDLERPSLANGGFT
jgi:hypothetical protein